MGLVVKRKLLTFGVLLAAVAVCQADFGAEDLFRQSRALRQQPRQQQQQQPLRPQQRRLRPAENRRPSADQPIAKRSNDLNRFSSFGLTDAELNFRRPAAAPVQGYPEAERDGGRYDQNGNRLKYANPDYSDRRSEQVQEPSNLIEDVPRPQYRYPKPSRNEVPSTYPASSRVDQVRNPVLVDAAPEGLRRVPEPESPNSRSDVYGPASGPADSSSAPSEQREIEAAVINGANAFGIPTDGVYQTEDRLSFQIHGQQGPHSYKYGYDTGNGYNRQFRYEERDGAGYVKGRYGFFDKYGKLQVVNYSADPLTGFHAEGAGVPEYPH